jgi:hypothetical protein
MKYGLNFMRWGLSFSADKLFRRQAVHSFTKLLLSKKTIELVFRREPSFPDLGI